MADTAQASWRDLPPIPEDERPEIPEKLSQTFASRIPLCRRSALLYHRHKGPGSHQMDRGSVWHEFAKRAITLLIEQDESRIPPEVAKDLMAEVMAEPEWTVAPGEADRLRVMAYHFAEGVVIDPAEVVAFEQMFELDLGWVTIRGKPDLVLARGDTLIVRDYKTSLAIPSQADYDESWQAPFYAVLVAFGTTEDGQSLGGRAQSFDLGEWYPMYLWDEGLAYRQKMVSRPELIDHRLYIEGELGKARHAFETGEWPAIPGSHCSTCAAPSECPLPERLRSHRGTINSLEDASEAAAAWKFDKADLDARWKELRAVASNLGPIPLGLDQELRFEQESRRSTDHDGLQLAVQRAVDYGEPMDVEDFIKTSKSTRFKVGKREVEPESRDWGEDAPW